MSLQFIELFGPQTRAIHAPEENGEESDRRGDVLFVRLETGSCGGATIYHPARVLPLARVLALGRIGDGYTW